MCEQLTKLEKQRKYLIEQLAETSDVMSASLRKILRKELDDIEYQLAQIEEVED